MNEELNILLLVAQRLDQNKIVYMISGSMAANYYTIPRMTRDIDVVIELKRGEIDQFVKAFEVDFWIDAEVVERETLQRGMFNLIHKEYVIKIDFILRKESEFQESAFERRKNITIENQPIWFISAEDLVLAKLLWAKDSFSELQLNDVRHLLQTVVGLDRAYVDRWVQMMGLVQVYNKVKQ